MFTEKVFDDDTCSRLDGALGVSNINGTTLSRICELLFVNKLTEDDDCWIRARNSTVLTFSDVVPIRAKFGKPPWVTNEEDAVSISDTALVIVVEEECDDTSVAGWMNKDEAGVDSVGIGTSGTVFEFIFNILSTIASLRIPEEEDRNFFDLLFLDDEI